MLYHFRAGRGKNILIDEEETFKSLGFAILDEYNIFPEHLFSFTFSNGDMTVSASPFGLIFDGIGNISIDMKIKDRHMEVGEIILFEYDYGSSRKWKVKLIKMTDA